MTKNTVVTHCHKLKPLHVVPNTYHRTFYSKSTLTFDLSNLNLCIVFVYNCVYFVYTQIKLSGACGLASALTCALVTVTTTVLHMSRLQALKECEYTKKTRTCTCYPIVNDPQQSDDGVDEGKSESFILLLYVFRMSYVMYICL